MSIDANGDRTTLGTVYLELSDRQSHKFYEVTVDGARVTIRYGRIGTQGQSSNSTYATVEEAQTEATKKINEKLRKGYVRISSDSNGGRLLSDLPPQYEPLRPFLEANLQPYIKIHLGEKLEWLDSAWDGDPLEPWQSKAGGYPYLPKGTDYPTDRETGEMMMFLMQVNCADLPIIDGFALPRQGILQFYTGLRVPESELSPEQHRILYFPKISQDKNNLMTDFNFLAEFACEQEWYDQIYSLTFSAQQDVFRVTREGYIKTFDVPEELEALCREFDEWWAEQDNQATSDRRQNKLGGEVESHSEVHETVGEAKGQLLLELEHPDSDRDYFYFFIEASDLANLDFSKVESYFMRV